MLPYWLEASRDDVAGGFLLHDDVLRGAVRKVGRVLVRGRRPAPSDHKQLVTQARLVWVFAHAHRKGYDDGTVYLEAAEQGRRFLLEHFRDPEREGYRWMTDRAGRVVNDVKLFYAQAFVVYALVELSRASGRHEPLDDALTLFRAVERELHDDQHGGWREQADDDWSPVPDDDPPRGGAVQRPQERQRDRALAGGDDRALRRDTATTRSGDRSSRRSTSAVVTCSPPTPAGPGSRSSPTGRRIPAAST